MQSRVITVTPPADGVYRLARGPADPFEPPPWSIAGDDGTFGNRFDDPSASDDFPHDRRFRVLYCATRRIAAFGETMARFRPSIDLLTKLAAIDDDEPLAASLRGAVDPGESRRGLVPADWRLKRRIGHTVLDPTLRFVDIAHPATMQDLRTKLAPLAARLAISDIDLSTVTSQQRRFTQACARHIHDDRNVHPHIAGIRYLSRLNPDWECWAIFDDRLRHAPGHPGLPKSILADDADLLAVAQLFDLTIDVFPGQEHVLRP